MSDTTKTQLNEAKNAFEASRYSDAESILQSMPQDDLKVQHNLATIRFLQQKISGSEALAALHSGNDEYFDDGVGSKVPPLSLQYEGHETAVYNQAAIYARSGLVNESILLLRRLLENADDMPVKTVAYCLCLFHVLTRPMRKTVARLSSRHDEELVQKVLKDRMAQINAAPELMKLVEAAFADSSALHDVFKDAGGDNAKQVIYLNNLGTFSMYEEKPHVANLCFAKAYKAASTMASTNYLSHSIQYNIGLCALMRQDHEEAVTQFLAVQDSMKSSPVFWVRFAEAAVVAFQRHARLQRRAEYAHQQDTFRELLQSGKVYANFEFLLLPGATHVPTPASDVPVKETSAYTAMEQLASITVQNALFLLVPRSYTFSSAMEAFPQREVLLQYAMLYWISLELHRHNYMAVAEAGQELLNTHERHPLPPNLHATLIVYLVEALVHLNDPDRSMKVLRRATLSSLVSGSATDPVDPAQRSRMEAVFVSLAVTHILNGSWNQAHSVMDSLLQKIYDAAPATAAEYQPERDVMFAYHTLAVFLELAQGNQEKAAECLAKVNWSL